MTKDGSDQLRWPFYRLWCPWRKSYRYRACSLVWLSSSYARKLLHRKSQTSMALVWDTNIADIMSCEQALYKLCGCVLLLWREGFPKSLIMDRVLKSGTLDWSEECIICLESDRCFREFVLLVRVNSGSFDNKSTGNFQILSSGWKWMQFPVQWKCKLLKV